MLSSVNDTLGAVNSVLGSPSTASSSSGSSRVYIDAQTKQSVISSVNKATANGDVKKLFNEAKPTIEKMIADAACTDDRRKMGKYADPDAIGYLSPFSHMYYHKSGCLNVLRINNFKKKTTNAFSFSVSYISPQSEETCQRNYTAIKQPDGEWLFKWSEW